MKTRAQVACNRNEAAPGPMGQDRQTGLAVPTGLETEHLVFKPSPIHGTGGFARTDLARGMLVIEYVGKLVTRAEAIEECRHGNEYIFRLDEQTDLDGNVEWNPARFLNHSCAPNCEAELIDGKVWIVALRDLKAGEEATFDYGYDLEDYRRHPCRCGAPDCVGYIISAELRETVRQQTALLQPSR
jgi:uncharacterized protein